MTAVYIKGAEKAMNVVDWIKTNLKTCEYELDMDPPATFSNRYKFKFKSSVDATMVALKWGNEYVGV